VGLKLNRTHQLLVYGDVMKLSFCAILITTKKCTGALLDASKKVGLGVNIYAQGGVCKRMSCLVTKMQGRIVISLQLGNANMSHKLIAEFRAVLL
jgi:hypothetical protein